MLLSPKVGLMRHGTPNASEILNIEFDRDHPRVFFRRFLQRALSAA
jgi:hypothetical protein